VYGELGFAVVVLEVTIAFLKSCVEGPTSLPIISHVTVGARDSI